MALALSRTAGKRRGSVAKGAYRARPRIPKWPVYLGDPAYVLRRFRPDWLNVFAHALPLTQPEMASQGDERRLAAFPPKLSKLTTLNYGVLSTLGRPRPPLEKRTLRQPSPAVVTSPPGIADKRQINVTAVSQPGRRPIPSQLGTRTTVSMRRPTLCQPFFNNLP